MNIYSGCFRAAVFTIVKKNWHHVSTNGFSTHYADNDIFRVLVWMAFALPWCPLNQLENA